MEFKTISHKNILFFTVCLTLVLNLYSNTGGLITFDSSSYILNSQKLLSNLLNPLDNVGKLIMPERGTNGPGYFYMSAFTLTVFSFLSGLPLDYSAKMTSTILFIPTILLLYHIGNKLFNPSLGLIWAVTYAISPYALYYSSTALIDTSVVFVYVLSFAVLLEANNARSRKLFFLSGFILGLAYLTKLTVVYYIIPMLYLIVAESQKQSTKYLPFFVAGVILASSPFIVDYLFFQGPFYLNLILSHQGGKIPCYFDGEKQVCDRLMALHTLVNGMTPWMFILVCFSLFMLVKRHTRRDIFVLIWFFIPFIHSFLLSRLDARYLLPMIVPATLLASLSIEWLLKNFKKHTHVCSLVVILYLLIFAYSLEHSVFNKLNFKTGFNEKPGGIAYSRRIAGYVLSNSTESDIIVVNNPMLFYLFLRRPVVLNWKQEGTYANEEGVYVSTWYSGFSTVHLNTSVKYWVMSEKEYRFFESEEPEIFEHLIEEKKYSRNGIIFYRLFKNRKHAPSHEGKLDPKYHLDLNLRDAVTLFRQRGDQVIT